MESVRTLSLIAFSFVPAHVDDFLEKFKIETCASKVFDVNSFKFWFFFTLVQLVETEIVDDAFKVAAAYVAWTFREELKRVNEVRAHVRRQRLLPLFLFLEQVWVDSTRICTQADALLVENPIRVLVWSHFLISLNSNT